MTTRDALDVLQTGKRAPWYTRAWRHLTRRQQSSSVGWRVRALIVFALMLIGIGWVANVTSTPLWAVEFGDVFIGTIVRLDDLRWWSTWIAVGLAILVCGRFTRKMRKPQAPPDRVYDAHRAMEAIIGRGGISWSGRNWRRFVLANLVIFTTYAIVADQSWNRVLGWMWNRGIEIINWAPMRELALTVFGLGIACLVFWIGWRVIQKIRAKYGRREPYERTIRELRRALEDERHAFAQLREIMPMVGQCLATGIVRIRVSKNQPKAVQSDLLVKARMVLQNALNVLITDETTRDAMLERSRRLVEGEDNATSATPSPAAPAT